MEVKEPSAKYRIEASLQETEVGLLPQDWQVIHLSTRAEIQSGIAKSANATLRDPTTVPYLRVANVQDGYLDLTEVSTIDIERGDLSRYAVLHGDVLMNEGGDLDKLGRGAIWSGQVNPCVHQNHVFVVRCKGGLVPEYLNAWISGAQARRYFMLAGRQTTNLASINKTSLGDLTIAVPPTEVEQQDIAKALTDADALIDSLEQLLTKKRQIKQGAMQELLTGKRRLPGFDGDWEVVELRQLGRCVRGVAYNPSTDLSEGDGEQTIRLLRSNNVQSGEIVRTGLQFVDQRRVRVDQYLQIGDLLLCMANGSRELVGKAGRYLAEDEHRYTFGAFMGCYRTDTETVDPAFVSFHFQTHAFRQHIDLLLAGSSINNLRPEGVLSFSINIPKDHVEQCAIAEVLTGFVSDLTALKSRLTKARALKQAMAQALLTGRIRLVEPKA